MYLLFQIKSEVRVIFILFSLCVLSTYHEPCFESWLDSSLVIEGAQGQE